MSATICIMGATVTGNHGAEAMLSATVQQLRARHPGCRIHVFSYYPHDDRACLGNSADIIIEDGRPLALLACCLKLARAEPFRRADFVIDIQGISFNDERLLFLPFKIASLLPALLRRKRIIKLAQSMGPFAHPLNRWAARLLLPRCAVVIARGDTSFAHLQSLGLPPTLIHNAPDTAFSLDPAAALSMEGTACINRIPRGERLLGLVPSHLVERKMRRAGRNYTALLMCILREATRQGYHVVVFPGASRFHSHATTTHNHDLPTIARLRAQGSLEKSITWIEEPLGSGALFTLAGACDALVTSRFHAMVAALAAAKPCLALGWHHKYADTLRPFGLERYALDWRADESDIMKTVAQFLQNPPPDLHKHLARVREASLAQFDLIIPGK